MIQGHSSKALLGIEQVTDYNSKPRGSQMKRKNNIHNLVYHQ